MSKGDTPLGYVRIESLLEAFENLSFVRQQLTDAKQQLEETKWECRNLEAENAKLRKCVEAADAFFLVEDAMSNATEEGVGKDLWIESQEHRSSYDAARAEVGE